MSGMINLSTMDTSTIMKAAKFFSESDLVPKDDRGKPANIMAKWEFGAELGMSPMASLRGVSIVNGRASLWGDSLIGVCMSHDDFEDCVESFNDETMTATCIVKRKGRSDKKSTFSKSDAQLAGLWDERQKIKSKYGNGGEMRNPSPWYCYPKRMLQMRARGFALRDAFGDKLGGLISAEEAMDYPAEKPAVRVEKVIRADFSSKADMLAAQIDSLDKPEQKKDKPVEPLISRERKVELVKEAVKERQEAVEVQEFDSDGVIEGLDDDLIPEDLITKNPEPVYKSEGIAKKSHPVMNEIKNKMGI